MNSVRIEFENVKYSSDGKEVILKGIDGQFPAGKLTGILGPSGAGKSSLLKILGGLLHEGVSGNVLVNNKSIDSKTFRKLSCYIAQEDVIQNHLTVRECCIIAADLKLGRNVEKMQKRKTIDVILKSMCLEHCTETKTQHLSGGQRKRLIIALELMSNPPVLFLDEPTTGLDEVTVYSCLRLFKKLTKTGRTIICTIHQPSDNVFKIFDYVYFLSNGKRVYEGQTNDIIPFLEKINIACPTTHSPADYLIEIVHENEEITQLLSDKFYDWNRHTKEDQVDVIEFNECLNTSDSGSFSYQVSILVRRRFIQVFRNKMHLSIEIGHHVFSVGLMGILFYKMGNDASALLNNLFIFYAINNYLMFTHGITLVMLYPSELKLLQREHLNKWYSLRAYYAAFTISHLPISIIGSTITALIMYYTTGQPTDALYRVIWFTLATILYGLTSQGFGLVIGTIFKPAQGACVGSAIGMALVLLSIYTMGYGTQITPLMKAVMSLSYVYHAYTAYLVSIFRFRAPADCDEIFCYLTNPSEILDIMGMGENDYYSSVLYLCLFLVLHRIIAYVILKGRVNPDSRLYKMLK